MRCNLLAVVFFVSASLAFAQPKPPVVPPTFPTLTTLANLGGQRGKTVELQLTGTNLLDATGVWTSFEAKVTIPEGQKDAGKLNVKIEIPAGTTIGFHSIRVATKNGISGARPFIVDDLPEFAEKDNNKKSAPQLILAPAVVLGTTSAEAADFYKVAVKANEPTTFEVLARRIGSPLDPVIFLYDANGKELPGLYADDTPGLQSDCRVTATLPTAQELIVEVRDSTYRGGGDFAYRLRIGNFPGATTAFPLAIERSKSADIGFAGPGLDGVKPVKVTGAGEAVWVSPKRDASLAGWPVPVRVSDYPELVEQEPNNTPAQANKLPVPGGISARFGEKNDLDHFQFAAKKGLKYAVQALTFEVNAPTEVYFRILDSKGAEQAKSNPQQVGTRVEFTAPADGDFVIACEHTNYMHGPNEVYHLSVKPLSPDFAVSVGVDRIELPLGGIGLVPITALAKLNGFNAPVELEFVGNPNITGKLTLPANANPQPTAPFYLPLIVKPGTPLGPIVGQLKATAKIDGKDEVRIVDSIEIVKASLAGMPTPPREFTTQCALAIVPELPYSLELKLDAVEVAKGGVLKGKLIAKRGEKFDAEIVVSAVNFPATSVPKLVPIKKGEAEAVVEFSIPATVPVGANSLLLRGTAKVNNKDVVVHAGPVGVNIIEMKK